MFELIDSGKTLFGNNIRIDYSLIELSGEDQNVELQFVLNTPDKKIISDLKENKSISANSTSKFKTILPINESLLPKNKTTNETLETELELLVKFNSKVYSSSIQENVVFNPSISGLAVFGGENGAVNLILIVIVLLTIVGVFFGIRFFRTKLNK